MTTATMDRAPAKTKSAASLEEKTRVSTVYKAKVMQCRSATPAFYLKVEDGTEGWYYAASERHFAIAAAAQAANVDAFVQYSGYNPDGAAPGWGLYDTVTIALQKWTP